MTGTSAYRGEFKHGNSAMKVPRRVVVLGAGFVGGAIALRAKAGGATVLSLRSSDLDLLDVGANRRLVSLLDEDDTLVFVSAKAPAKTVSDMLVNIRIGEVVARALEEISVSHVIYISSDAVYPDGVTPLCESSLVAPSDPHGMMHAARELMLKMTVEDRLAILRPSTIYGVEDPHNSYGPNRFRRLAEQTETITLFGEGEERRDHVLIDDVAEIAWRCMARQTDGVLNVATGSSHSFREVAEIIADLYAPQVKVKGTPRANPITHRHFDVANCLRAFPDFRFTALKKGLIAVSAYSGNNSIE